MRDNYEYVRNYYNVPAYLGMRVRATVRRDETREGVLVKQRHGGHYVDILFDGDKRPTGPFHPTDGIEYLPAGQRMGDQPQGGR